MKKMLRFVGIAALAAVIGFGFASCEGPAGLTGTAGGTGGRGNDGAVIGPATYLSVGGANLVDGVYVVIAPDEIAIGEVGHGFYETITLTSTVAKVIESIDFNPAQVAVALVGPAFQAHSIAGGNLPINVGPGVPSVQLRLTPQAGFFANNARTSADITIRGSYGTVEFARTVRLELVVGVDKALLVERIAYAEARLAETFLQVPEAERAHGRFYATDAVRTRLQNAITAAGTNLGDARTAHGNAETRAAVVTGNNAVNGFINTLNLEISTLTTARGLAHSVDMPVTWAITGTTAGALRPIGPTPLTLTSTPVATGVEPPGVAFQWQRRADEGSDWVDIPGATGNTFILSYGRVRNGEHVRAVITHANFATRYTSHIVVGAAAAPAIALSPGSQTVYNYAADYVQVTAALTGAVTAANIVWTIVVHDNADPPQVVTTGYTIARIGNSTAVPGTGAGSLTVTGPGPMFVHFLEDVGDGYTVTLTAVYDNAETITSNAVVFTLDTAPPSLVLEFTGGGYEVDNTTEVTRTVTATVGGGVTYATLTWLIFVFVDEDALDDDEPLGEAAANAVVTLTGTGAARTVTFLAGGGDNEYIVLVTVFCEETDEDDFVYFVIDRS